MATGPQRKRNNDWIKTTWRPMMGWQYMITCTFDFIVFPILYAGVQVVYNGNVSQQWHPITLEGAGLYHIAMGAVLGVAAWTRGHEKILVGHTRFDRDESYLTDDEYQEDTHSHSRDASGPDSRFPTLK